jgi:serine/threonine protein kinase
MMLMMPVAGQVTRQALSLAHALLPCVQCHAKGIIYRDIKPDNFLFLTNDEESPLKATDFGLSIRHWPDEPKLTSRSGEGAEGAGREGHMQAAMVFKPNTRDRCRQAHHHRSTTKG